MKLAIYLITSVLIMAAGIFMIISDKKRRKGCTATATATVVDIKTEIEHDAGSTGSDTTKYIPVLQFCAGGNQVVAQGNCSSLKRDKYSVGERIEIIYNPDKPTVLFMDTQANLLLLLPIASIIVLLGIVRITELYATTNAIYILFSVATILLMYANITVFWVHESLIKTQKENTELHLQAQKAELDTEYYGILAFS